MRKIFALIFTMFTVVCIAQVLAVPTRRILPEDIEQDSIQMTRFSTNRFVVRFSYTEAGAKKMLDFRRAHAGGEVVVQVGSFERRVTMASPDLKPPGWTEEGWLKRRTDKFFGVSEDDAKKIVGGLKSKDDVGHALGS